MKRVSTIPRSNWPKIVESQGLFYHSLPAAQPYGAAGAWDTQGERPYWDESAYYHFDARQIDELEECTYRLNEHCLEAVEHIIANNLFATLGVPAAHVDWVRRSWDRDEHTIYGRFDLRYVPGEPPKLLEYNADTPTGLLEAAVVQWYWLKDCFADQDQYNSIHERLLEAFGMLKAVHQGTFYFAALAGNLEDFMTVNYLRDCAIQAGWATEYINVEDIGWHEARRAFTDTRERAIRTIFKLYPWEWMVRERFGEGILWDTTSWFEPPWKILLSNKALLAVLYELFPGSPYLLPASFEPMADNYVEKPIHGREGANIEMVVSGRMVFKTEGPYEGPYIYQEASPLPCFDGNYPVIGSWLINGYAAGIGIREDSTPITTNTSRFVPHIFSK
jgi:glutathionylspermidine synthase